MGKHVDWIWCRWSHNRKRSTSHWSRVWLRICYEQFHARQISHHQDCMGRQDFVWGFQTPIICNCEPQHRFLLQADAPACAEYLSSCQFDKTVSGFKGLAEDCWFWVGSGLER